MASRYNNFVDLISTSKHVARILSLYALNVKCINITVMSDKLII